LDPQLRGWESTSGNRPPVSTSAPGTRGKASLATTAGKESDPGRPNQRVRPTLLVVDDEPGVLRTVHDLLRIDYHVITCESGARALEILRSSATIDVIMSDQRMPGMTGVEVLRQAREIRPEATRLLFTAYTDIRTVVDAINQGHVYRYLAKPWEPEELEATVRQAVEHHNLIVEKNRLLTELQETNAKLMEANRLKGAFIEVASHELNTPVTVVLGMLELWKMTQGVNASNVERQWVERIGAAAGRLARTVERMLKLVRNREFSQSVQWEALDLKKVVRDALDELAPHLEHRRQSVIVQIDPDIGPIAADTAKIADVLTNLLANAVKFTPDGGTIRLEARREEESPDWVRISITDQGVGVAPDEQSHLFEPFFTGFDTLRHSSGDYQYGKRGIGLGLWLVKTFVELHGGRVEVSSMLGQGSTFSFLLPRAPVSPTRPITGQPDIRVVG